MKLRLDDLTLRVESDRDLLRHDPEACDGCGRCALVCVAGLWTLVGGVAQLGPTHRSRCFECGACFHGCPARAIDFCYPPGGCGVVYERG